MAKIIFGMLHKLLVSFESKFIISSYVFEHEIGANVIFTHVWLLPFTQTGIWMVQVLSVKKLP